MGLIMASRLDPQLVAARLQALRELYEPATLSEVQALMTPPSEDGTPLDQAVARRFSELRAMYDLSRHLHRAPLKKADN